MRAQVIIAKLELPIADAIRQHRARAEIHRFQIAVAIEREPRLRGPFDVPLKSLGSQPIGGSEADQTDPRANRRIPKRMVALDMH